MRFERQQDEVVGSSETGSSGGHDRALLEQPIAPPAPVEEDGAGAAAPAPADPSSLLPWVDDDVAAGPSLLGFGHQPTAAPIRLNPNAPATPRAPLPLVDEADLKARADRLHAEQLLTSKDLMTSDRAVEGMEVLLGVAEDQRAKVIDGLDDAAFENLLERVPEDQRERFAELVESSRDPARKLRLWAEYHKSRAGNDLRRYAGDFGDEDTRTDAQQDRLDAYERREAGVVSTNAEVDGEVARLLAKAQQGELTVAEVDQLRARKDLELAIEMDYNLKLTADTTPRADDTQVAWSTDELQQVRAALAQLPDEHVRAPESFNRLHRDATRHFMLTRGGTYSNDEITVFDRAHDAAYGRQPRTHVSDELRGAHGDTVGGVEYVVTHEIGHSVEDDRPKAFEKFKRAAGWKTLDTDAARAAGLRDEDLATLDARRDGWESGQRVVVVDGKEYAPGSDKGEYHQVDEGAIPDDPRWKYAKSNAQEHFAEVYARAVLEPEALHRDLVAGPAEAARAARVAVADRRREIARLRADPSPGARARLAELEQGLPALERGATRAARIEQQRGAQFHIMRDDVFGTDRAVTAAVARLRANKASPAAIRAFQERAARVSTPAQVAALEADVPR